MKKTMKNDSLTQNFFFPSLGSHRHFLSTFEYGIWLRYLNVRYSPAYQKPMHDITTRSMPVVNPMKWVEFMKLITIWMTDIHVPQKNIMNSFLLYILSSSNWEYSSNISIETLNKLIQFNMRYWGFGVLGF